MDDDTAPSPKSGVAPVTLEYRVQTPEPGPNCPPVKVQPSMGGAEAGREAICRQQSGIKEKKTQECAAANEQVKKKSALWKSKFFNGSVHRWLLKNSF